jgi:hypothetical protein
MASDAAASRRHLVPSLVAAAIGVSLVVTATPQLIAALSTLDSLDVASDIRGDRPVKPDHLTQAAEAMERARSWFAEGEMETERGYLLLRGAEAATDPAKRDALYRQAAAATMSGLALAPAQPAPWARLAWLRVQTGDLNGAVKAYRLSLLAGPVVPSMMVSRLELGLRLKPRLDPETLDLLARQVRQTWVIAPEAIALLSADPSCGAFIREALAEISASQMDEFQRRHGNRSETP